MSLWVCFVALLVRRITMNRCCISKPARMACCRWAGVAGAILSVALVTCWFGPAGLSAQDRPPLAQKAGQPSGLERVPGDAAFLLSVRVPDLWNSEPIKAMRQQQGQELAEGAKGFEKEIGVAPGDIERVTLVL